MKNISVGLGGNSYGIRVGPGLMARTGEWLKEKGFSGKAVVITDTNVKTIYAGEMEKSLAGAGFQVTFLDIPPGEEQKTLDTAGKLYDRLAASFAERSTVILAMGGGVVGDLAGFVAATYMRGVPYVQVPTSLLAMVDSSIGGKTAVDRGNLKNVIGAFYQPRLVIADIDTIMTLPREELSNGMAEVVKVAAVSDRAFFNFLEENIEKAMTLDAAALEKIVLESAKLKAKIVGKDEKEAGRRIILNYGHTVGHALEVVSGFKLKHGAAVAIGMISENKLARRLGLLSGSEAGRILGLIKLSGLPVSAPEFGPGQREQLLDAVRHDKKVLRDKVRFVLLKSIGRPVVRDDIETGLIGEVLFGGETS